MSKVAQYLNEHLQGEVTTADAVREKFSTDSSILRIAPDMVAHPRLTSDIRKIARFSWQLAEKGHKLPITPRGAGSDQTGAAIGSGLILNLQSHMNEILEFDTKQKLVRLQPGVNFKALNDALKFHGLTVPNVPESAAYSTVGGAIANNASSKVSDKYGSMSEWVQQVEVVLSNGDVIQTGRISKRELNRKKGQQDFEGEIYRGIDTLLIDNAELINSIAVDVPDNMGYNIIDVGRKDGSIDLTPLFIGSQGTLGIISEVIVKSIELTKEPLVGALSFASYESALDGIDVLRGLGLTMLEMIDGRLFETAASEGKRYTFYADARGEGDVAVIVLFMSDSSSGRVKKNIAKKITKTFEKDAEVLLSIESKPEKTADLLALRNVTSFTFGPEKTDSSTPPILDGAYIPPERFDDFTKAVADLEHRHNVDIALYGHAGQSIYYARPRFTFSKVTERQKLFKLLNDWTLSVAAHGGHVAAESGEGRLKATFAYRDLDDDMKQLIQDIRAVFDPQGIMNTGVKQEADLKQLAGMLRTDYNSSDFVEFAASN